jgi:hypothetical protein
MSHAACMNRELVLDQHIIEAWGLWWVQWQNDMKSTLRQGYSAEPMSSRVNRFAELHLSDGSSSALCQSQDPQRGSNFGMSSNGKCDKRKTPSP